MKEPLARDTARQGRRCATNEGEGADEDFTVIDRLIILTALAELDRLDEAVEVAALVGQIEVEGEALRLHQVGRLVADHVHEPAAEVSGDGAFIDQDAVGNRLLHLVADEE